ENEKATTDGKAAACELLSRIGTSPAVFPIAALLADPVLVTHALAALERIPRGEANRALREAVPILQGNYRIGVINAMGNRGAAISIETLAALLDTPDHTAAATALGTIGDYDAAQALLFARTRKGPDAALEKALLQCANGPAGKDTPEYALSIYEFLYREGTSEVLKIAGFNGLLQHHHDPSALLLNALKQENTQFIPAILNALESDESLAKALVEIEAELAPEIQNKLGEALAVRTDAAAAAAIGPALQDIVADVHRAQVAAALNTEQQRASVLQKDVIFPDGYQIVTYLNCGAPQRPLASAAPSITLLSGLAYTFPGIEGAVATAAFHEEQVVYKISKLNPKTDYVLGFTWWDADNSGRRQSVRFSEDGTTWDTVLPAAPPLTYSKDKSSWARVLLPLTAPYGKTGILQVAFVNEAGPNAVVNEIFLLERIAPAKPKRVVIVTGDDYTGHDWRATAPELAAVLREDDRLEVSINECPAFYGSPLLKHYNATVLHFKNYEERIPLNDECLEGLADYVAAGNGLVIVHFGCGAFQDNTGFVSVAGRIWNPALRGHDPHGTFKVHISNKDHPVTKNIESFETTDELYTCLDGNTPITVLCDAVSTVDKQRYPMAFVVEETGGRVFHSVLGHDPAAFHPAEIRDLYRQAALWAAGLEIN
ncbi:MAG: ThuA domain-containing protein, partial [Candidatus Hydrogenedentes bacterium]|nr:ThuA domain-containing protein [Candidatus Hydrogenedentota bacterium]